MKRALSFLARERTPRARRFCFESLERRALLAADCGCDLTSETSAEAPEGESALLARYQIRLVPPAAALSAADLTTVNVGESYDLVVTVQQADPALGAIFAGYLDIGYDSSKTRVRVGEVQRVAITGALSASGTFSLAFGSQTTEPIPFTSDAAVLATSVENALAALNGVGTGNVKATVDVLNSPFSMVLQVRFVGTFLDRDAPNLALASQDLSGPGSPVASVTHDGDLQSRSNAFAFKEAFRSLAATSEYQNGLTAEDQPNVLNEVGAFAGILPLAGSEARELVRARMIATAGGVITFQPDFEHLKSPESDTLLYGVNEKVKLAEIVPGPAKALTVVAPNSAPSFVKGANQTVTDEAGPQNVPLWATAIVAGPSYESTQLLSFDVASSDISLFSVQPAVDAAGNLTFAPKLNAEGTAQISVVLRDDGGTANGGVSTSPPQVFEIQIEKLRPLHNAAIPLDTSGDGAIVAEDALECINFINLLGSIAVEDIPLETTKYLDVDADGFLAPSDPLMVINHINAFGPSPAPTSGGEGESTDAAEFSNLLTLLAEDAANQSCRRKRG